MSQTCLVSLNYNLFRMFSWSDRRRLMSLVLSLTLLLWVGVGSDASAFSGHASGCHAGTMHLQHASGSARYPVFAVAVHSLRTRQLRFKNPLIRHVWLASRAAARYASSRCTPWHTWEAISGKRHRAPARQRRISTMRRPRRLSSRARRPIPSTKPSSI